MVAEAVGGMLEKAAMYETGGTSDLSVFERSESEVRSYCRSFPTVFARARGSYLFDEHGREYLDFFCGAGALNYGHNHPRLKRALLDYLADDGITHGLDMATTAKRRWIERFREVVLEPRGLDYKLQFPGPTGTNAVEAALKLARKVTGRETVVAFTNAFHGMTLGALAVTGDQHCRGGAGLPLGSTTRLPFDGYLGELVDTAELLEALLRDPGSGVDRPAAVILETIQGEGGVNVARDGWLRRIASVCREYGVLVIVDDVQAGCGRSGPFFSFEPSGIEPDIVCLSKSLSGMGLPLALTLLRPELDVWKPGEHNGTFRGNNPAFVTATEALHFWETTELTDEVLRKGALVRDFLEDLLDKHGLDDAQVRGRGLMLGVDFRDPETAKATCRAAFAGGLVMETAGPGSTVAKLMPSLLIEDADLERGLQILAFSLDEVLAKRGGRLTLA